MQAQDAGHDGHREVLGQHRHEPPARVVGEGVVAGGDKLAGHKGFDVLHGEGGPDRLDARDGKVAIEGWAETSEMTALDLARHLRLRLHQRSHV